MQSAYTCDEHVFVDPGVHTRKFIGFQKSCSNQENYHARLHFVGIDTVCCVVQYTLDLEPYFLLTVVRVSTQRKL